MILWPPLDGLGRLQLRVSLRINDNDHDALKFCIAFAFMTCNTDIPGEVMAGISLVLLNPIAYSLRGNGFMTFEDCGGRQWPKEVCVWPGRLDDSYR